MCQIRQQGSKFRKIWGYSGHAEKKMNGMEWNQNPSQRPDTAVSFLKYLFIIR
jgi:hypothetical protein